MLLPLLIASLTGFLPMMMFGSSSGLCSAPSSGMGLGPNSGLSGLRSKPGFPNLRSPRSKSGLSPNFLSPNGLPSNLR